MKYRVQVVKHSKQNLATDFYPMVKPAWYLDWRYISVKTDHSMEQTRDRIRVISYGDFATAKGICAEYDRITAPDEQTESILDVKLDENN